jgi:phenylacetate-CoA ligase
VNITPLDPWISQKIDAGPAALSRPDLEAYQLHKLNETLALAHAKSAFYRKHFSGMPETLQHLEDLQQFPFTTPEDVRRAPLQFVCVSQDEIQRVVTLQSSGTTGAPKRIYFTAADQELTIDFFGVGMSTLVEPGQRVLILLPGETPGSVGDLLRVGLGRIGAQPIPYGPVRDPLHTLETMQVRQADCLVGSPTQVLGLARRWKPGMHRPGSVLLSTDYVPTSIVKTLEETWGCAVFNHYGATEMGLGGGVECQAHRGYHLREADLYFEVIDPLTGQVVPEGQPGEVVFTTLTRRGMPLIRYRMDDRSRWVPGTCACGTALKMLEAVSGRFGGFIPLEGGTLRLPDLDEALFAIPDVLNFSVTLTQQGAKPCVHIETQLLAETDRIGLIGQALGPLPALARCDLQVHCHHNPTEPGSLLKRTISDQRGSII